MIHTNQIAGIVVLYNPDDDIISNIKSYLDQIAILFAIDNSEVPNKSLVEIILKIPKVIYIFNGTNLGLAKSLNIGAEMAIEHGYDYLLTMDQDSKAAPNMVSCMLQCLEIYGPSNVGIVSPFHQLKTGAPPIRVGCHEVTTAMTSGNLLNLSIYKITGPFQDDLFVDYVDHEYCLKLHVNGYKVVQSSSAILEHRLGDIKIYNINNRVYVVSNHSPLRRYYMTRNRFFVMNQYRVNFPQYYKEQSLFFRNELFGIIFFEKDKINKLKMVLKGYLHYRLKIFGKFK